MDILNFFKAKTARWQLSGLEALGFLFAFVSGIFIFRHIIYQIPDTDIHAHVEILLSYLAQNSFPPVPVYYLTIFAAAFFSTETAVLYKATIFVLAGSLALKYAVSLKVLRFIKQLPPAQATASGSPAASWWEIILLIGMLFVTPVYIREEHTFINTLGITIWHNSTSIFLLPFAVLLFLQSYKFLKTGQTVFLSHILLLCIINILIKPSFFFAFAPVFGIFALAKFYNGWQLVKVAGVLLASALVLLAIYITIYFGSVMGDVWLDQKSSVIIAPFQVWRLFSDNLLKDSFISLVYPLAFSLLYFNRLRHSLLFGYTAAIFLVAVAIYIFLAESGPRFAHGNFGWQVLIANYILFLVCVCFQIRFIFEEKLLNLKAVMTFAGLKNLFLLGLLFLHVVSGFRYLHEFLVTGSFF